MNKLPESATSQNSTSDSFVLPQHRRIDRNTRDTYLYRKENYKLREGEHAQYSSKTSSKPDSYSWNNGTHTKYNPFSDLLSNFEIF